MGYTDPIERFDADMDKASLCYNHEVLVDRWGRAFGQESMVLHEYARSKPHNADIIRDFAAVALSDVDSSMLGRKLINGLEV